MYVHQRTSSILPHPGLDHFLVVEQSPNLPCISPLMVYVLDSSFIIIRGRLNGVYSTISRLWCKFLPDHQQKYKPPVRSPFPPTFLFLATIPNPKLPLYQTWWSQTPKFQSSWTSQENCSKATQRKSKALEGVTKSKQIQKMTSKKSKNFTVSQKSPKYSFYLAFLHLWFGPDTWLDPVAKNPTLIQMKTKSVRNPHENNSKSPNFGWEQSYIIQPLLHVHWPTTFERPIAPDHMLMPIKATPNLPTEVFRLISSNLLLTQ